jgi:hypothetical protein
VDFNFASIPATVSANHDQMFDAAYIRDLFDLAYDRAAAGYPWEKVPPDFDAGLMSTPGQAPADPSPTR